MTEGGLQDEKNNLLRSLFTEGTITEHNNCCVSYDRFRKAVKKN